MQAAENVPSLVRALDHAGKYPFDENLKSALPPRRFSSIKEVRRQLDSKTAECEYWKTRAELAEKRLDELKLALTDGSRRSSDLCSVSEEKGNSDVVVTEQVKGRASARQSQLPATASILTQEKLGLSSSPKNPGVKGSVSPDRTVSNLRKGFGTDNIDSGRYESNPMVAMRGKLINTQLTPFSM
ncbi:hypothetical protein SEPCBS57363_001228 [Sporothrix epigloea]|uniref:Uncharacterized protein n=1 Tax=Sporothrix epigloea TaxID=1892477 RepID=A0ABP0DC19_9PEZI